MTFAQVSARPGNRWKVTFDACLTYLFVAAAVCLSLVRKEKEEAIVPPLFSSPFFSREIVDFAHAVLFGFNCGERIAHRVIIEQSFRRSANRACNSWMLVNTRWWFVRSLARSSSPLAAATSPRGLGISFASAGNCARR